MSLTRETLTRLVTLSDRVVTVADPDNLMGSPAFEGLASDAARHLIVGHYPATLTDGTPVTLAVSEGTGAVLLDLQAIKDDILDHQQVFALLVRCQRRAVSRLAGTQAGSPEQRRQSHLIDLIDHRRRVTLDALDVANRLLREATPCAQCAMGTPVPHRASTACRSGRRPHCTCDTCW